MTEAVLFSGGMIWTGTPPRPRAGWLLLRDGRVAASGGIEEPAPAATQVVDLQGRHVLPGFVDAHSHLSVSAWLPYALDGSRWTAKAEVLETLARYAATRPPEGWIVGLGADFDAWRGGMASAAELDDAGGGRPVLLMDLTLHRGLISSSGIQRLGDGLRSHAQAGDIDYRRGAPNGLIWESASAHALKEALTSLATEKGEHGQAALLQAEAERHLALGITSCHDPCIPASMQAAMQRLSDTTPLRLSWSSVAEDSLMNPADLVELCPHCGEGPASAKLFVDGAHKCALCLDPGHALSMTGSALTQALRGNLRPVKDLLRYRSVYRQRRVYFPYLRLDGAGIAERLEKLAAAGVRPKIHALGNHAAACACQALRETGCEDATLEHLTLLGDAELDAIAATGAVASIQTGFIDHYGPTFLDTGLVPRLHCLPAASLRRRGVPLALSSDNPCGPLDPLHNIRAAVTRRMPDGRLVDPDEALEIEAAVEAYTIGGYRAIHGQPGPGLAPGAPADLAILDGSPELTTTRVVQTWIDGRPVWGQGGGGTAERQLRATEAAP